MSDKHYVASFDFAADTNCYCGSQARFGQCCGNPAPNRTIPGGIAVVHDFLPAMERKRFLRFAEKQKRQWLMINDEKKSTGNKVVGKRDPSRVTQRVDIRKKRELVRGWMMKAVTECIQPVFRQQAQWFEEPQLLRYGPGGRYTAHADADHFDPDAGRYYRAIDRDFSLLIYLNDDYEGGGIRFVGHDYIYQPVAGDLVFFPSGNIFTHESLEIERGCKYALVSWGVVHGSPRISPRPNYDVIPVRS